MIRPRCPFYCGRSPTTRHWPGACSDGPCTTPRDRDRVGTPSPRPGCRCSTRSTRCSQGCSCPAFAIIDVQQTIDPISAGDRARRRRRGGNLLDEHACVKLQARETLALLCEREIARPRRSADRRPARDGSRGLLARDDYRRIHMALRLGRFPAVKGLSSFDYHAQPSVDPRQIRRGRRESCFAGWLRSRSMPLNRQRREPAAARPAGRRQNPSRHRLGARRNPRWIRRAVRHRDDARGLPRQGAR